MGLYLLTIGIVSDASSIFLLDVPALRHHVSSEDDCSTRREFLAKTTTVEFEGKMVPAELLEFESEKEPWSAYKLEDGTVFKMKQTLVSIFRLIDRFKPDGEPIYIFKAVGIVDASVPDELKNRKAN
jgi:hypothetical protein